MKIFQQRFANNIKSIKDNNCIRQRFFGTILLLQAHYQLQKLSFQITQYYLSLFYEFRLHRKRTRKY